MTRAPKLAVVCFVALLGAVIAADIDEPRSEFSLNGEWLAQKTDDLSKAPREDAWSSHPVPGYLSGVQYERAWLKRSFYGNTAWAGKRIKLRFGGVKFNSVVMLNDGKVGGNFGGYEPFTVDITGAIKLGATNELMVGAHDWTGVFFGKPDLNKNFDWENFRSCPKNALLSPIGGLYELYGIWDDVSLQILPPIHVEDVFIKTSVRNKRITAEVTVANETDTEQSIKIRSAVFDCQSGARVLELPEAGLLLKPRKSAKLTLAQDWPNPMLWSHLTPNLYDLRIEIVGHDMCATRFGFREFQIKGDGFYLNGKRINLLATSTWPKRQIETKVDALEMFQAVKDANCVAMRLHTQPWQKRFYEAADEAGILIVVEGAVWCDQNYRFEDPVWWENYALHLRRTVDNLKNHPSIVMWSLENEILHCAQRQDGESPAKIGLAKMGTMVKKYDPTRPIFFEADIDPLGAADVIGLHYPEPEYPKVNQYPNVCYWLDEEITMKAPLVDGQLEKWKWDRAKPLYIGEFLWVPPSLAAADTIFFGDTAYKNFDAYRAIAKAAAWKMQIEAYRWFGVGGICPWTMFEGPGGALARKKNPLWVAVRESFHPNAVFIKEYNTRFFAGSKVQRALAVYNDAFTAGQFILSWQLTCKNKTAAKGEESFALGSAEKQVLEVELQMPETTRPEDAIFLISLQEKDRGVVFEESKQYRIFPATTLSAPTDCRAALYDPDGATERGFAGAGLVLPKIGSLAALPKELKLLVIGEHVFKQSRSNKTLVAGQCDPDKQGLMEFVRRGGRVLVLAQEHYPENFFFAHTTGYASTMTFAQSPSHPILKGISDDDLKFWAHDNMVSEHELIRPSSGPCLPLVVSGSSSGLSHLPMLEQQIGKGVFVLCQMRLVEKLGIEPATGRILQNAIDYLASFKPIIRPTFVVSKSKEFKLLLAALGIQFTDVTGNLDVFALPVPGLLIMNHDNPEITERQNEIRSFIEAGGAVLFHRLTPQTFAGLSAIFPKNVKLQPHRGLVTAINHADSMTLGWTYESLSWLGPQKGSHNSRIPPADGVADFAFVSQASGTPTLTIGVAEMTLEGHLVKLAQDHAAMFTQGSLSKEFIIPKNGRYGISVTAKGTPMDNVWPLAEVALDGETIDIISTTSREWSAVMSACVLDKGAHKLELRYINDACSTNEDRNFFVKQIDIFELQPGAEGFVALTRPAYAARFDIGKGSAIVDEVAWSAERRNVGKALQYAQALFTALGAEFHAVCDCVIGPDDMAEDKAMPLFTRTSEHLALACSGAVSAKVKFAAAGVYIFELHAAGTPLAGIYPIVELRSNGRVLGAIELQSEEWRPYHLEANMPEGEQEISIVFTNDEYNPPEDRNLYIRSLGLSRR